MTSAASASSTRSLVLAGGGVRLAYHAGVLLALEEAGLQFGHVDGTSGGIFGTAMIGSGISAREAASRWRALKLLGFLSMLPLKDYRSQHSLPAMGGSRGIREKIFPALGIDIEAIRRNRQVETTYNVCNFSKKTLETIGGTEVTEDHLVAGMSLPMFSPAVKIGDDWYTDGIWIKDANLRETWRRGAEDIWLVWCIGNNREYLNGLFNQYVHMIEISANAGLFGELQELRAENEERSRSGRPPVRLHIIRPEYPLPLDPDFFLNHIDADTLIAMGYADTKAYLAAPAPFDFRDIPGATAMKDPGATLHFRQTYRGKAVLGGISRELTLRLGLFLREAHGRRHLQLFSCVDGGGEEVHPAYGHVLRREAGELLAEGRFLWGGEEGLFRLRLRFTHRLSFLLGLGPKTATASFEIGGVRGPDAIFVQPAGLRLRHRWHVHLRCEKGWSGRRLMRRRLLDILFKPEAFPVTTENNAR